LRSLGFQGVSFGVYALLGTNPGPIQGDQILHPFQ